MRRRNLLRAVVPVLLTAPALAAEPDSKRDAKYYFKIVEVTGDVDDDAKKLARELLETELGGRAEFAPDLGSSGVAAKGRRSFNVSLKFDELKKELKEPKPGGRLKQLAVGARLNIFGAETPSEKLAFSGHGESTVEAEIIERKLAEETRELQKDVIGRAVKEAVDQAVLKLALPQSEPPAKKKRKRGS